MSSVAQGAISGAGVGANFGPYGALARGVIVTGKHCS